LPSFSTRRSSDLDGLFVPVLRDVANRDAEDLRAGLDRLRADVLNRSIPPRELMGATITLSNYGTLFGRYASPVVVPPQVAIVGDRKSTRLNSSHVKISYAVFCLKK